MELFGGPIGDILLGTRFKFEQIFLKTMPNLNPKTQQIIVDTFGILSKYFGVMLVFSVGVNLQQIYLGLVNHFRNCLKVNQISTVQQDSSVDVLIADTWVRIVANMYSKIATARF